MLQQSFSKGPCWHGGAHANDRALWGCCDGCALRARQRPATLQAVRCLHAVHPARCTMVYGVRAHCIAARLLQRTRTERMCMPRPLSHDARALRLSHTVTVLVCGGVGACMPCMPCMMRVNSCMPCMMRVKVAAGAKQPGRYTSASAASLQGSSCCRRLAPTQHLQDKHPEHTCMLCCPCGASEAHRRPGWSHLKCQKSVSRRPEVKRLQQAWAQLFYSECMLLKTKVSSAQRLAALIAGCSRLQAAALPPAAQLATRANSLYM